MHRPDGVEALTGPKASKASCWRMSTLVLRVGDLRHAREVAFEDDRARHAARDLDVRRAVTMGVIPVRAGRMGGRDGDLDLVGLPRFHLAQHVVGDAVGTHMQAVGVQVGRVDAIREVVVARLWIAVGRQLVDEANAQHVAGTHAKRRPRRRALVGAQMETVPADVLIRVADPERGR